MISPAIEIELTPEALAAIARAQNLPSVVRQGIARGLDKAMPLVLARVQETRLLGKGPYPVEEHRLGQVTSNLTRRAYVTKAAIAGDVVSSSIGTPVPYARVHEFGFTGTVQVRAHPRKRFANVALLDPSKKRGYSRRKTRLADGEVRGHSRQVNFPARQPFGFGLADAAPIIRQKVSEEVIAAVNFAQNGGRP